jgi:DDE superfamily endonuclease
LPAQKKPRKGALTRQEKEQNRKLSQLRVRVEHSLAGVKRCRSVKDVLRNTKEGFSDLAIVVACGLHNLRLECRKKQSNKM